MNYYNVYRYSEQKKVNLCLFTNLQNHLQKYLAYYFLADAANIQCLWKKKFFSELSKPKKDATISVICILTSENWCNPPCHI